MQEVYLALGSNVGDSRHFIDEAIKLLSSSITNIVRAPIYKSKAVGYTDQADFFNTIVQCQTNLSPGKLLKFIKDVEKQVGRVERFRWGPREIDIDIIFYGQEMVQKEGLTIPHPRFRERDFVLLPLCDLSPNIVDPETKLTVKKLLEKLPKDQQSGISEV